MNGNNFAAAFLLVTSQPTRHVHQNHVMRRSVTLHPEPNYRYRTIPPLMFGKPSIPSSSFQRHNHPPTARRRLLAFLAASSDESADAAEIGEEQQQEGMEKAFASLEALSSEEWDAYNSNDSEADKPVSYVKYSLTDDTLASDTGKSTEEEVEYYLEMQGELEGTATSTEANQSDVEDADQLLLEIDGVEREDTDEEANEEPEYPWTSINPILRLRGPVASGYGRGGKKLGVPTANLPASLFQSALEDVTNGVYFGWAVIEQPQLSDKSFRGRNTPVKAVVNVGYSPTFEGKENKEKIVEAHLITKSSPMEKNKKSETNGEVVIDNDMDEMEGDFYNETMRLQLIGYLRPEQKFDSFPELIAQIHRDIGNAHWALDSMPFVFSKEDEFIKDGVDWIGGDGGDVLSSWEFESW